MQANSFTTHVVPADTVTRELARFVATTKWSDIPAAARHEAKRALVNYVAVSLSGCRDPVIDKAVAVYSRFRANENASVIGRGERTDMLNAAALNAMSANVFDFDDTHMPTIIHPTAPVAAPLLALAEAQAESATISGEALLLAFALGVEVECRIGNAVSPEHYQRGWHITSTCGVFGAAAAVAKACGLNEHQIVWALGNASAQAGGWSKRLARCRKALASGMRRAMDCCRHYWRLTGFLVPMPRSKVHAGFCT